MINLQYILAFSIGVTEIIRKNFDGKFKNISPLIAFTLTVICNLINAYIFGGNLADAGKEAFITGGLTLAIFSSGTTLGNFFIATPSPENTSSGDVK